MRIFALLAILSFSLFPALAQGQKKISDQDRGKEISKNLGISKEKSESLIKVLDSYQKSMDQLMKDNGIEAKQKQEKLKELALHQKNAVDSLLSTQEQLKLKEQLGSKYEKATKNREEAIKNKNKEEMEKHKNKHN